MDKRSKWMLIVTLVLFCTLIIKSTILDPVNLSDSDAKRYERYVLEVAPLKGGLLEKANLLTYRVIAIKKEDGEGTTEIMYQTSEEQWAYETLEGQYRGKVRTYLFYVLPIKDIEVKGGIIKDGN